MKYSTNCFNCNSAISFWRIMIALAPWQLKCPHCKSKILLKRGFALKLFVIGLVIVIIAAIFLFVIFTKSIVMYKPSSRDLLAFSWILLRTSLIYVFIPFFLVALIAEFITSLYIVNTRPFKTPK